MHRASLIMAIVFTTGGAAAFAGQLPGTLNYQNVTGDRINQTVPEAGTSEKEVEYGDFDNDGDLDVVIAVAHSDFGQRKNKMYRNDGGVFNEISATVPLFTTGMGDVARNTFLRDYDLDGWLDLIIVCDHNTAGDPGRTKYWRNVHAGGVHTGWVEEGNVRLGAGTGGAACGAVSINSDLDGDFDLYVGNYPGPSQDTMYFNRNDLPGYFTNMTAGMVPLDADYTVDVASADLNGDGKLDLLISNGFSDPSYIYYNNNQSGGTSDGDYNYPNSVQLLAYASFENAMEAGDFDGDGDQDIYWTNLIGGGDRILRNNGNDGANKATFTGLTILPPSTANIVSRKVTVADLNNDGRVDVFVMKEQGGSSRPTILRNTSVNNIISFVDWTPAPAFPSGSVHMGWHAAAFDTDGDRDLDIFLGGWTNDHLFENVPANEVDEDDLAGGALPGVYNLDPVAVLGHASDADVDIYTASDIGSTALISLVLNGPDDYLLELLNSDGKVLASSNRGGLGIEEALQQSVTAGLYRVQVTVIQGGSSIYDLDNDGTVGILDLLALLAAWGPVPTPDPPDFDGDGVVGILDLLLLLAHWGDVGGPNDYILEILSRSG
ncbi:MAG: VCBS repeat-containing protein [Planctomycetota bacterium]|nr:VCBS repeat-containing protein [Planctomycetota bacterium]